MNATSTDRIEKEVLLQAPRSKVWRALSDPRSFGEWFGAKLDNQTFEPGVRVTGHPTYEGYEHLPFELTIEEMQPERLLSWRWHPMVEIEAGRTAQASTLVSFELQDVENGTLLRVVETGFDAISEEDRLKAYRGNEDGWTQQMQNIERYVAAGS
jgi:uncharacterized protein YndB with AHSA1/START domain